MPTELPAALAAAEAYNAEISTFASLVAALDARRGDIIRDLNAAGVNLHKARKILARVKLKVAMPEGEPEPTLPINEPNPSANSDDIDLTIPEEMRRAP